MKAIMRLALLLGLVVSCVNAACPPGFVASTTFPSSKCYYATTEYYSFFEAINYCRNNLTYGADILSIANGFENSEVASLLLPRGIYNAWIGNAFYDNKSHWITTAASSSNYSNWGMGTYNGYAASINVDGSWSSAYSYDAYPIICQIYPDDPTTFPPSQITCPAGWTSSISVRGKCYQWIDPNPLDFFSSTRRCLTTRIGDSHAELLTLTSQLEMMELFGTQHGGEAPLISLTSWEADGYWRWVETLHPTDYFGPNGPPSDDAGNCAILTNERLYGELCRSQTPAICQYFPGESPAPTSPGLNCPQNGIASITKPGTCYYVLSQNQTFQSARSACRALNTGFSHNDLFVPRTLGEYEEFEAIWINQIWYLSVWLGLTSSNGNWGWISGRSSNITNIWCDGQPDTPQNSNDQCGFVNHSNYNNNYKFCWTVGDCTDSYAVICQSTNTF